jgi:hypothetical protein
VKKSVAFREKSKPRMTSPTLARSSALKMAGTPEMT